MKTWNELENECKSCTKCDLYKTRTNVVFGIGKKDSKVLFIGEGPGENEDLKGEPFVGRAGKLLDDMLKIIGLSRYTNIYIANIVKCRPPKNRDPNNIERDACINWLHEQISIMKPKIIVCLGRIAATTLIDEDFKVTRDQGKWFDINGIKYMALYHPAMLLRDPHKKPETFVSLKILQKEIENI
ncbi:MAG: uracil-DNA glycosylase [Oscillospiraceae bacterium]|jgi:DNA polymerase|nr:uracil-DNA glycosylase [Oscillospiraceae bacterium]